MAMRRTGIVQRTGAAATSLSSETSATPTNAARATSEIGSRSCRGYPYKVIARELSISPRTVETHVSSVLHKLQLSSRHQLTRWAAERRLI